MAASALTQAAPFLLRPASTYQALDLGTSPVVIGLIGAVFAVVPLVVAVPFGTLTDRTGEKPLLVAGAAGILGSAVLLVLLGGSVAGLLVGNAVLGAGHLAANIANQAYLANRAGARLDRWFGTYSFMASIGQVVGPLAILAGGGSEVIPETRPMFVIGVGVGALVLLICLSLEDDRPTGSSPRSRDAQLGSLALLRLPGMRRAVLSSGIMVTAIDLSVIYLPVLGAGRGLSAGTVSALLATRALASTMSRFGYSRVIARLGRRRLLLMSSALASVSLLAVALPLPTWAMIGVVAMMGLGLGLNMPLTMAWVTAVSPPGSRGHAIALRIGANRLGQVTFPTVLGVAAASFGAAAVFVAIGVAVGLTLPLARGPGMADKED